MFVHDNFMWNENFKILLLQQNVFLSFCKDQKKQISWALGSYMIWEKNKKKREEIDAQNYF